MKLSHLAKQIMKEDTWGNNPSSAGAMSPGKTPNAITPAPSPNETFVDVQKDYQMFETTIEKEEEAAKKTLEGNLKGSIGGKKVIARASKGSVGQTEQDYTIDVADVNVVYMSEKYYVVFKDTSGKDYYIDTSRKVKVLGQADKRGAQTPTSMPPSVGGIAYPQNMGVGSNSNQR
jgi:hypothetical protein